MLIRLNRVALLQAEAEMGEGRAAYSIALAFATLFRVRVHANNVRCDFISAAKFQILAQQNGDQR